MVEYIGESEKGIKSFRLSNSNGMQVCVITYGARIANIIIPSKIGEIDVVAGFDSPDGFMGDNPYFNAVIGRVANRIGGAKFTLDGKEYNLFKNDGENHLHGGKVGFDSRIWEGEIFGESVKMTRVSLDGEEGYPGNLEVTVTYTLTDDNALRIEYHATSDKDTLCSLTNHAYFNLDGDFESVLDHEVMINSDRLTDIDNELIPTGTFLDITDTPYDFRTAKRIGQDIGEQDRLLQIARGYDFNYVLNNDEKSSVATACSKKSGVKMSVFTDRPCMQLYTGNFLDGIEGKHRYDFQSAFCMETQGYPNACNVPSFDSMTLKAGEEYSTYTEYKFEF